MHLERLSNVLDNIKTYNYVYHKLEFILRS